VGISFSYEVSDWRCRVGSIMSLWKNFHAFVGAASGVVDLTSEVTTETQDGALGSKIDIDCRLYKDFFENDFPFWSINARHLRFEEGRLGGHLTHFKSANGDIRPGGIGIEKSIESGCRCGEVDLLPQKDGHIFDDKLRHGAGAEKAEVF